MHINDQLFVIIPQSISLDAQTFLLSMLQTDSNKRLSAKELLKHDFIKKGQKPNLNIITNLNESININTTFTEKTTIRNGDEKY